MAEQERTLSTSGAEKCPHCKNPRGKGVLLAEGRLEACPVCSTPEWVAHIRKKVEGDALRAREKRQARGDE
jgi:CRISPR/Cas system-associated protein Cas10 (large subunit of type III CRISPR-Cas system)